MLVVEKSLDRDFRGLRSALRVTTGPTLEPVELGEAKLACRYLADDLDSEFRRWISVAREMVEQTTSRALLTQTVKLYLDRFPADEILLHWCPVQSVSSVEYVDAAGDAQTFLSTRWQSNVYREPAIVRPVYGDAWPVTRSQRENAVTVTFVAGYGAAPASVPAIARQAVLMLVAHWFSNPEAFGQIDDKVGPTFERCVRLLKWGPDA